MILGDTNIDMLESNDQIDRGNIARTMPIYREILENNGLSVQNKKNNMVQRKQESASGPHNNKYTNACLEYKHRTHGYI